MSRFDTNEARAKGDAIKRAVSDLTQYLQAHFPKGARCEVMLSATQKNPTAATIYNAYGDIHGGTIMVEIDTAKGRRQRFRRISSDNVFNVKVEVS